MGMNEAYLPIRHQQRAQKLCGLWMLFSGQHHEFFVDGRRSRYHFRPVQQNGRPFFVPFDLLGLISRKTADLLFGEAPRIRANSEAIDQPLADLIERSMLQAVLLSAAMECSWAGESFLEIIQEDGRTLITHASAREIFPMGGIGVDGQSRKYVRYATEAISAGAKTVTLLLETTYAPGRISRECWRLGVGGEKQESLPISAWPAKTPDGADLPEEVNTGLVGVSIIRMRNDAAGESDYSRQLIDLQDALNAKQTQLARVILKHADPKMYFAASQANDQGNIRSEDDAIYGDTPEAMPRYITWEAQMTAALEDRKFALMALATVAEMPLSVLGVKDDATAESAAKMRLSAINAIAKAQRKAAYHVGAIRLAIVRALKADGVPARIGDISIQTRDGLPTDEKERAETIATLRLAEVISLRRALAMQELDDAEIKEEMAELADEAKQNTPSVLLGEPAADVPPPETTGNPIAA